MATREKSLSSLDETRRAVRLAAFCVLGLVLAGFVCIWIIRQQMLWANGMFYAQFISIEPPALVILASFALAVLWMLRRPPGAEVVGISWWATLGARECALIALAVLAITAHSRAPSVAHQ